MTDELTVYTRIAGRDYTPFHTSEACAPSVMHRTSCTLREAVEANRKPCGNCCGDDVVEAYRDVLDSLRGET